MTALVIVLGLLAVLLALAPEDFWKPLPDMWCRECDGILEPDGWCPVCKKFRATGG